MAIRAYSLAIDVFKVVLSDYVVDYTRLSIDQRVLMEKETDGYDFRYVYGLDKVNVKVTGEGTDWWGQNVKKCVYSDYVHTNRLGSVVNLSDQYGRVPARVDYSDWGEVTAYDSITVDGGFRVLLPEITYATHQYDDILDQFYAKARMYDASGKRFTAVDPILDPSGYDISSYVNDPMMLVQYLYVKNNAINWIDMLGLCFYDSNGNWVHDNWEYLCGYERKEDPMQSYLNGNLSESSSDFQYAINWWASHGSATKSDLKQFKTDDINRVIATDSKAEDFNRYDNLILAFTNYWNKKLNVSIDPNIVKAMVYVESRCGYYTQGRNGERDVMQSLDDANPAIHRLAAVGNYDPNEASKYIPRKGYGLFAKLYCYGEYNKENATPTMSIAGGILWLAHKQTPEEYNGGGDPNYAEKIETALARMY